MTQEKINEILTYLLDVMKQTGDLAKHEIPLVAKEVINYEIFSAVNWIVFDAVALTLIFLSAFRLCKRLPKVDDYEFPPCLIVLLILSLGATGSSYSIFCNVEQIGKCYFAPRIVIFEKLKGYVK